MVYIFAIVFKRIMHVQGPVKKGGDIIFFIDFLETSTIASRDDVIVQISLRSKGVHV